MSIFRLLYHCITEIFFDLLFWLKLGELVFQAISKIKWKICLYMFSIGQRNFNNHYIKTAIFTSYHPSALRPSGFHAYDELLRRPPVQPSHRFSSLRLAGWSPRQITHSWCSGSCSLQWKKIIKFGEKGKSSGAILEFIKFGKSKTVEISCLDNHQVLNVWQIIFASK